MSINKQIIISVVIPTKNRINQLTDCLKAIYKAKEIFERQIDKLVEIIVVDDNSEDNIKSLTEFFPEIKIVKNYGQGQALARNSGFQMARGEYIATTDSDCLVKEDWLIMIYEHFQSHDDCIALQGIPWLYSEPHNLATRISINTMKSRMTGKVINQENNTVNSIETRNVAFRRKVIDRQPNRKLFRDEMPSDMDLEAGTRLALKNKICWVPEVVSYHQGVSSVYYALSRRFSYGRGFAYYSIRKDAHGKGLFNMYILHQLATGVPLWFILAKIIAIFSGYCFERITNYKKVQQYKWKYC